VHTSATNEHSLVVVDLIFSQKPKDKHLWRTTWQITKNEGVAEFAASFNQHRRFASFLFGP
jgi:hypothetical protein